MSDETLYMILDAYHILELSIKLYITVTIAMTTFVAIDVFDSAISTDNSVCKSKRRTPSSLQATIAIQQSEENDTKNTEKHKTPLRPLRTPTCLNLR
jgi:hypothetical protein